MRVNSFVMSLMPPPRICVSERDSFPDCEHLSIDGKPLVHGYPDWLAFPDILFDSNTRVFGGLAFSVVKEQLNTAHRMCANLDKSVVRFRDRTSPLAKELYMDDDDEVWLEIIWTRLKNTAYAPAQLDQIFFYFFAGYEESGDDPDVVAFELF